MPRSVRASLEDFLSVIDDQDIEDEAMPAALLAVDQDIAARRADDPYAVSA